MSSFTSLPQCVHSRRGRRERAQVSAQRCRGVNHIQELALRSFLLSETNCANPKPVRSTRSASADATSNRAPRAQCLSSFPPLHEVLAPINHSNSILSREPKLARHYRTNRPAQIGRSRRWSPTKCWERVLTRPISAFGLKLTCSVARLEERRSRRLQIWYERLGGVQGTGLVGTLLPPLDRFVLNH